VATLDQQLAPLWRVGTDLQAGTLQRQALAQTAQELKEEAIRQMQSVIGADLIMRNYPRGKRGKPRKAGFGYELHANDTATLNFRPGGMWRIVEDGTSQHTIGAQGRMTAKGSRIGRRNESTVFKIGGEYRSGYAHVRGARSQGRPGRNTIRRIPFAWQAAFADQYSKRLR